MNKQSTFTFNHIEKTIVGTKSAIKRASVLGSDEYKILNKMMKEQPTYSVVEKIMQKKVEHKKTYGGLTLKKMEEFIKTQPDAEKNLIRLEAVKKVAKARNALYPLTKQWFLAEFPAYKGAIVISEEATTKVNDNDVAEAAAELDNLLKKVG